MSEELAAEFVEELPPVDVYSNIEVEDVLRQLKANPGRWALVRKDAHEHFPKRFPGTEVYRHFAGTRHRYDIYLRWPEEGKPRRELTWETPPEYGASRQVQHDMIEDAVRQLKARPGKWAVVETWEGDANTSRRRKWTSRGLEAAIRTKDGQARLYARWPKDA